MMYVLAKLCVLRAHQTGEYKCKGIKVWSSLTGHGKAVCGLKVGLAAALAF